MRKVSFFPYGRQKDIVDKNPIIAKIVEWGNIPENAAKIQRAYEFRGGWEPWAQVELAIYLQDQFGKAEVDITREDGVYENKKISDILFHTKPGGKNFYNMIELKCEYKDRAADFPGEVKKDCKKVLEANIKSSHYPLKAWVIALSITKNSELDKLKLDNKSVGLVKYPHGITLPGNHAVVSIYWGAKVFDDEQ